MIEVLEGDAVERLREMADESVQCVVTSPPYWGLRDYSTGGQLGLEKTPEEYVARMVAVFREVRRVLRRDGTLWLNLGDSYATTAPGTVVDPGAMSGKHVNVGAYRRAQTPSGLKPKDLCGIPWRVAFALQTDGWWLRSDIIWAKPNPMPESVTDRPTKSHEYLFLLTKSASYFYDAEAIREPSAPGTIERFGNGGADRKTGKAYHVERHEALSHELLAGRNKRSVWNVATAPFSDWTETVRWKRVEAGARGDGTRRIVSPNSQDDGGLFDLLATVLDDEHAETSLKRILGISDRLSLEPRDGYVPFEKLRAYYFGGESLDSFLLGCFDSASRRSIALNKMALFVATNLACIASSERLNRIERILAQRGWSEPDLYMLLNSTWPSDWPAHLWKETLYRIGDIGNNSSYEGMYRKTSEKASHFATYPPDLVKPCIMAGTSAKGCCARCGAPWERVVEASKDYQAALDANKGRNHVLGGYADNVIGCRGQARFGFAGTAEYKTLGWQPTCECSGTPDRPFPLTPADIQYEIVPCIVLDPFAGSGTTGAVALELGRKAVLIELNPAYCDLIEERCNVTMGLALA